MSVDINELAAHLDARRQTQVKEQYDARATHATTAFLLCFFLGYLGAHRFYLRQWRSAFARLILFVLGAAGLAAGYVASAPLNAALFVIGGLLILACLIWEVIDLGRIDNEIHQRNLLLAEGLIAGALLSDTSGVEAAAQQVDEVRRAAAAQSLAASAAPAGAGAITAEDLAQARNMAEQTGRANISYESTSTFDVSATPEERADDHPVFEPATTTERHVDIQPLPAPEDAGPAVAADTHTHHVDAYRVTDEYETDRVSGPSAAEVAGLGAAALGAAGVGYGLAEAAHTAEAPSTSTTETPASEVTPISDAAAYQPADQNMSIPAAPINEPAAYDQAPAMDPFAHIAPTPAEAIPSNPDVTDSGAPSFVQQTSDVAFASAYPSFITLPEQSAGPAISPIPDAAEEVTQPDLPLYFTPEEETASEPVTQPYTPYEAAPTPQAYTAPAAPMTPSWEEPTEPVPSPTQESHHAEEALGLGALAGAGALAADAWGRHEAPAAEPAPEPAAEAAAPAAMAEPISEPATEPEVAAAPVTPEPPKMKRIRVKHRIVVDGQVVREESVVREIPADADMAEAARQIQAELEQGTSNSPDEIARMANLSPEAELEIQRRVEGLNQ